MLASDFAPGEAGICSTHSSWSAAELGRQAGLIHVDTPNRGKIHI